MKPNNKTTIHFNQYSNSAPISTTICESRDITLTHLDQLITSIAENDTPAKSLIYSILREKSRTIITQLYDFIDMLHSQSDEEVLRMLCDNGNDDDK